MPVEAPKGRGREPKKPKIKAHPFAVAGDELRADRESISGLFRGESAVVERKTLLLPTTQKGPLPSPWLIREEDYSADNAVELAGWDREMLAFDDANAAFDFLLGLLENPPRGFAFRSSLRFRVEAARFSLELIAKQQFMPTIREDKRDGAASLRAAWEVVMAEEDEERVRMLAEAMPH